MGKKILILSCAAQLLYGANQTTDTSPVLVQSLPFLLNVELADFALPQGIQSAAYAQSDSKVLFITGRTNGLHSFDDGNNNFPPNEQNTTLFVVDLDAQTVYTRSLHDKASGLNQKQIDSLSVTSAQYYQSGNTLYITGGYGVDTATGTFNTKDTLTAIDVAGLIDWVINANGTASDYIRQINHPIFQVTGGVMRQTGQNPTLLIFGQNYSTFYTPSVDGDYTRQVRKFFIIDDGKTLGVNIQKSTPINPNYRRRDLNVVPIIKTDTGKKVPAYVALAGVFTESFGYWSVPVEITADGFPSMANPKSASTFKQSLNVYACAHAELLANDGTMYSILFGGLTFEYYQNGALIMDSSFPFNNQIAVLSRSKDGDYKQYLLPNEYPIILSTASNPGNRLLFGTGAIFIPAPGINRYSNNVLDLTKIKKTTVIGYIIGGIQSTLPDTNTASDSAASPYIFTVTLTPRH